MAIRSIKYLQIICDTCKKVIAIGKTSTEFLLVAEQETRFTEVFCTECVKLPCKEDSNGELNKQ